LTKEQNIEIIHLACSEFLKCIIPKKNTYFILCNKKWWDNSYQIELFADKNLIAISVQKWSITDFGGSKKVQNEILNLIKEKSG